MSARILLLLTDLKIGGTPTVVRELAVRLSREPGVEVHVACLARWGPVADQLHERGVEVTALNARRSADVAAIFRLKELIRRHRFDTVLSFLVHANGAAAVCRPFFPFTRFLQSIQTTQANPKWHWAVQRAVHPMAEKVVVPSFSAALAARRRAGVPKNKIVVIPNAVEPADFQRPAGRSGGSIGFVGRLDPVKHVGDLVAAMMLLDRGISLHIFGDGEDRPAIQYLVDHLNLQNRVTLHGTVAAVASALATLDVLVLPSEAEGFGLVLIEAMAAGVPVVATDVPGIRDVVTDRVSGLLVPPTNIRALADAIRRVLSDEDLRDSLIRGGREAVEKRFSWDKVFEQYKSLLL